MKIPTRKPCLMVRFANEDVIVRAGDRGRSRMYYLVSKIDRTNHAKVLKEPFATEDQAIARARLLFASGEAFACVLEDDNGTVADDAEMAERCKGQ